MIAEAWDATFVLFDGVPNETDIERLAKEAPQQEVGRYRTSDLVLSRANKSVRLFEHVVESLASGRQPNRQLIVEIGYLMRTTAVYANGKFGLADRSVYADRVALSPPFQAEMLTVYLIRCFTFDLVEHVARCTNPDGFVPLNNTYKRYLGIGNATGLGMAPFLVSHPTLIHHWFHARETALADIRRVPRATAEDIAHFRSLLAKAAAHVAEWNVEDETQTARIEVLRQEVEEIAKWARSRRRPSTPGMEPSKEQTQSSHWRARNCSFPSCSNSTRTTSTNLPTSFRLAGTSAQRKYDGRRTPPTIGRSLYVDQTL